MKQNKFIVGVFGARGAGKTTFANIGKAHGAIVIDCDIIGHEVLENEAKAEVIEAFGTNARKTLAEIVFSDETKLKLLQLNEIVDKYIVKRIETLVKLAENGIIIIDAAELHRTDIINMCDYVVAIVASGQNKLDRIVSRDLIDTVDAKKRLQSQPQDDYYLQYSDKVIENNGNMAELTMLAEQVWDMISKGMPSI
jgi:dephospho-CoA kinase